MRSTRLRYRDLGMGLGRRTRGFTLIEAMVVVVLIGVLALIASVAYGRWVRSAHLTEAQDMVANMRSAEESFRAENGGYLTVSAQLGPNFDYPATNPGPFKTAWGLPCGGCVSPFAWTALNIRPNAPLAYGYSLIANNTGASPPNNLIVNGTPLVLSAITGPWYVIEADADMNGNGIYTNVYAVSATNHISINLEDE